MRDYLRRVRQAALDHPYGVRLAAPLFAAGLTGAAVVAFMRAFEAVSSHRLTPERVGWSAWIVAPIVFWATTEWTRRQAPEAAGTGIPQAIFAARHMAPSAERDLGPLVSIRTLAAKVLGLLSIVAVGAATGREGPSVHVGACVFLLALRPFRRVGISFDPRSAVVAGAAAGLAAAFNTPLAGVTFAVEELVSGYFSDVKDFVLLAIIVAAIAAKALYGEYLYFGRLVSAPPIASWTVIVIGVACGLGGALFSTLILRGQETAVRLRSRPRGFWVPVSLTLVLLALGAIGGPFIFGPGNEIAQRLLTLGRWEAGDYWFGPLKMLATLATYWAGGAGGIFAPCLSIGAAAGAAAGAALARALDAATSTGALIGMAALLSGTIQAPMTSFVIIFEMTGHHEMLVPVMLGSLIAFMTARLLGARHLYQALSEGYAPLLGPAAPPPSPAH